MENRKSRKSTFLYVILLTLCVPLAYVYLILVTGLLDKIQEGHIGLTLMIVFLPLFFYWGLVAVVGIINIGQSFLCEFSGSVHLLFFHKYGSAGRKPGSRDNLCSGIAAMADCSSRFFGWCNMACYFTGKLLWDPGDPYDL